ncbi:MAG: hypothetical protein WA323_19495, partial [Candidatus Nitrosopolaris sp.]
KYQSILQGISLLSIRRFFLWHFFSITIAASLFAMPVIYHHLQYPYNNLEKFKLRSHRFTILGLVHSGITLYLGIEIALASVLNTLMAFALATIPFIFVYVYFRERR